MQEFDRITQNPLVMGGKTRIRGIRVTVSMIGSDHSVDELLADHPYLERDDIMRTLGYAAWRVPDREVDLASA